MGLIDKVGSRLRRNAGISLVRTHLYKLEASATEPPKVSTKIAVRIALVAAHEIELLRALGVDDLDDWRQRLDRGDLCYAGWVGSELVHYSWVQTGGTHPIAPAGVDVPIGPGDLWIYNCRTCRRHRGFRFYPRILQQITREQFQEGSTTAWIYTAAENVSSQHGIERAGFVRTQTLRAVRFGRRYRALSSENAPGREGT